MIPYSLKKKGMHPLYNFLYGSVLHCFASVQDPPNPCTGVTGSITEYQISFKMGLFVAIENVNTARCINGGCSHTFEPHSNPPSSYSYDRVSVAAENVVGVGPARNCTTQTISEYPIDTSVSTCFQFKFQQSLQKRRRSIALAQATKCQTES